MFGHGRLAGGISEKHGDHPLFASHWLAMF
jgi:hypothetical protein